MALSLARKTNIQKKERNNKQGKKEHTPKENHKHVITARSGEHQNFGNRQYGNVDSLIVPAVAQPGYRSGRKIEKLWRQHHK